MSHDLFRCRSMVSLVIAAGCAVLAPSRAQAQAIREHKDVIYATVDGKDLGLDIYVPAGVDRPPLLVWVHGGAWTTGTKAQVPKVFVANGIATASLDFRQSTDARFPAAVHDIKAAIRFLRAKAPEYGYRTERIAIGGSSSGGHLAALVGVTNGHQELEGTVGNHLKQSSNVQAILDYYGASNLTTILAQSTPFGLNMRRPALERLLGALPEQTSDLAKLASPVVHVDRSDPPLLLLHGDQDPQMPVNQAHELEGAYKKLGLDVSLDVVHGAGHGGDAFFAPERLERALGFLRRTLGNAAAYTTDLPYKLVEWPTPLTSAAGVPAAWNFIQVASVAVTARGTILVLHRGAHPIMEFESSGKFVRSWGDGMFSEGKVAAIPEAHWTEDKSHYSAVYGPAGCASCGAHSVRVDPQGNIWVVDAPGHVVYKMNPDGKEIMRLGTRGVSGTGPNAFNLPTDVAFAANGDIYVSDGYGSARVVKYSRDGKFLLQWGTRGKGPGAFGLPHNLVIDAQGRVYVTDRDNQRIEVFDANGTFLTQWTGTGGVSGLAITKDQRIWTGGILRDLEGKVLGRLPGSTGAHGVAVTGSGDVYLAQLSGVVQKFIRLASQTDAVVK